MFKRATDKRFTAAVLFGVAIYRLGFTFGEFKRNQDRNLTFAQGYHSDYPKNLREVQQDASRLERGFESTLPISKL